MALSAVAIRNAKARDKAYKLTDADGLYLMVMPSGARYWRMNYRFLGKQKTLAFGVWTDIGPAEARERLGYAQDEMTGHGFRARASSLPNEMKLWHPDAIERQLAHADKNAVSRACARGEYWEERVQMMQHWSDHLDFCETARRSCMGLSQRGSEQPSRAFCL